MSSLAARSASHSLPRPGGAPLRVAFLGAERWIANCAPPAREADGWRAQSVLTDPSAGGPAQAAEQLARGGAQVTVIFDPPSMPDELLAAAPGVTLGVLVGDAPEPDRTAAVAGLDRLVSFRPALSGTAVGDAEIWRAIPPPVSDAMFGEVTPTHGRPRVMSVGTSTDHREGMLVPAKHHHELLQVIDGLYGPELRELLREYEVAVYVPRDLGGGFGAQVGIHLAAGQLLLSDELLPSHGLERDIDYLRIESPEGLVWMLDRMGRFPEMYRRVRIRGRLKAEQYRASRLFARLTHDLLADVAAFGPRRLGAG